MRERCRRKAHKDYESYGGRGIEVCDRWESFALFVEDMGKKPPGHTLDRIDNDGNYEPSNCRWADSHTQSINKRKRKSKPRGAYKNNSTGVAGVYELASGRYRAMSFENGKNKSLGCYATQKEAEDAVKKYRS